MQHRQNGHLRNSVFGQNRSTAKRSFRFSNEKISEEGEIRRFENGEKKKSPSFQNIIRGRFHGENDSQPNRKRRKINLSFSEYKKPIYVTSEDSNSSNEDFVKNLKSENSESENNSNAENSEDENSDQENSDNEIQRMKSSVFKYCNS